MKQTAFNMCLQKENLHILTSSTRFLQVISKSNSSIGQAEAMELLNLISGFVGKIGGPVAILMNIFM
jgi:hypothetical protein